MPEELTAEERRLVEELLAIEDKGDRTESLLSQVPLLLGAIIFVAAAIITVRNPTDRTALWVMLPGTVAAMVLFGLYLVLTVRQRVRRRCPSSASGARLARSPLRTPHSSRSSVQRSSARTRPSPYTGR